MGEIYTAVKNIIIFMLLITVFMNLLGKSSFKQYIRIFVGLVMILIVIKPILTLINAEDKVNRYFNQNLYKINAADITEELYNAEEQYQGKIIEEYKSVIKEQIDSQLQGHDLEVSSLKIDVASDPEKENCGEILGIDLVARNSKKVEDEKKKSGMNEVDQVVIDKININKVTNSTNEDEGEDSYDTVMELTVKQELVSLYGVNIDNISVKIIE